MYPIKRAAELLGMSEASLRAWETRYGVGATHRTASGYRLYDDAAIRTLRAMRDLVAAGWSVRAAADEVRGPSLPAPPARTTTSGGGAAGDVERFVRAAAAHDTAGIDAILDERFGSASFETVVDDWLLPALQALGAGWAAGEVSVAAEHLAAHAVVRRVATAHDAAASTRAGRSVLVGLPPGARHDIGLLAFSTAARRAGLATSYLGADVPVPAWTAAVAAQSPACVVIAVPTAEDADAATAVVEAVRAASPAVQVAVGGSAQDLAPEGCLRLGHRVGPAASLLALALEQRLSRS